MPVSFFTLPPEIRNRVYDLSLCIDGEICPIGWGLHNRWQHVGPSSGTGQVISATLLRTCRQVYHEAVPILYGKNHFSFLDGPTPEHNTAWDMVGMYAFFVIIGRRNRMTIRTLTIHLLKLSHTAYYSYTRGARELGETFELLSTGHGLRRLHIHFGDYRHSYMSGCSAYVSLFSAGTRVVENLEKIKGVESFEISGHTENKVNGKSHDERVKDLMEVMQVGIKRERTSEPGAWGPSATYQTVTPKISRRIQLLEEERGQLAATVASLASRMKEMDELKRSVAGIEELRRKVDELVDLI